MDKVFGIGKITANSVIVYKSTISKLVRNTSVRLSFTDSDAYPFARFPIMKRNGEIYYKFYIGKQGSNHGSLMNLADNDNAKILGSNWRTNPCYNDFSHKFNIFSAGRIWTSKKFIVMRDANPSNDIVRLVKNELLRNGFNDLNDYKILYEVNGKIHECTIDDYIDGCTSQYGYKTIEDISHTQDDNNVTSSDKEILPVARNFYNRYGLGDSIVKKGNKLLESKDNCKGKRIVRLSYAQLAQILRDSTNEVLRKT